MFNKKNQDKNRYMLTGSFKKRGYDWWWHSFTAYDESNNPVPFFFEFYLINPKFKKDTVDLGLSSKRPSFLMIKFGHWGKDSKELNYFVPLEKVEINTNVPFSIKFNNCYLTENKSYGKFEITKDSPGYKEGFTDLGSVSWCINIDKQIPFNVGYGTSKILRFLKAFQMYWHAEGMKSNFSGEIIFNQKKYTIKKDKSYGYADKNWGRGFTSPWVWLSSNNIYSKLYNKQYNNSVFDIGGGCPKVYFVKLKRKLLSAFYIEGKRYEFNFSKLWTHTKTKFSYENLDDKIVWHVSQENRRYKYYLTSTCKKDEMIKVRYIDPFGIKRFNNLWNGGNGEGSIQIYKKGIHKYKLIDDLIVKNMGCEYGEFDFND